MSHRSGAQHAQDDDAVELTVGPHRGQAATELLMLAAREALDLNPLEFERLGARLTTGAPRAGADGNGLRLRIEVFLHLLDETAKQEAIVLSNGRKEMAATKDHQVRAGNPKELRDSVRLDFEGTLFLRSVLPRVLAQTAGETQASLAWVSGIARLGGRIASRLRDGDPVRTHLRASRSAQTLALSIWPLAPEVASAVGAVLRGENARVRIGRGRDLGPGHSASRELQASLVSPRVAGTVS